MAFVVFVVCVHLIAALVIARMHVYLSASALSCFSSEESYGFAKLTVSDRSVCFWGCICCFEWLLWHKEDVMIYI